MAKEKRPRWESEGWKTQGASDRIVCKTCMFRPTEINGIKLDRADTASCQIYEYPDHKPNEVYFDGADCENYGKEE
jgi:hypothetical protein